MDKKFTVILVSLYIVYKMFFTLLLPIFVGFAGGGFEVGEILDKFQFYVGVGIGFTIATAALIVFALFYFKDSEEKIDGVYLYPGKDSFLPKFLKSPVNLIFIFLILFSILAFLANTSQTGFFSAIPHIEQQFTPAADITFAVFPAAPAENAGLEFFITLALVLLGVAYKKYKIDARTFIFAAIFLAIMMGALYGVSLHALRYGFDEFAMNKVAIFWAFSGLLFIIFGFLSSDILHINNNLGVKLNELFASDIIRNIGLAVIVILIIIYVFILLLKYGGKKNVKA